MPRRNGQSKRIISRIIEFASKAKINSARPRLGLLEKSTVHASAEPGAILHGHTDNLRAITGSGLEACPKNLCSKGSANPKSLQPLGLSYYMFNAVILHRPR
jgi:hypothetical protein